MTIPDNITAFLKSELNISIKAVESVSGGSINQAAKINTERGYLFLKWNRSAPNNFFEMEAAGLQLLRSASSGLRVPEVVAEHGADGGRPGFLLMEYIAPGSGGDSFRFGEELAALHGNRAEKFGLEQDNYIGSLPQSNTYREHWLSFFAEMRIEPQLKMAVDSGKLSSTAQKGWVGLLKRLDTIIPECKPSLLHGDLWSGNYMFDNNGRAVLIDPAVYYGHPEMDLSFTKMFGGFDASFYEGYRSAAPLEPDFEDRVPVYNLYPLLVHVNLFGGHYSDQCRRFLMKF